MLFFVIVIIVIMSSSSPPSFNISIIVVIYHHSSFIIIRHLSSSTRHYRPSSNCGLFQMLFSTPCPMWWLHIDKIIIIRTLASPNSAAFMNYSSALTYVVPFVTAYLTGTYQLDLFSLLSFRHLEPFFRSWCWLSTECTSWMPALFSLTLLVGIIAFSMQIN